MSAGANAKSGTNLGTNAMKIVDNVAKDEKKMSANVSSPHIHRTFQGSHTGQTKGAVVIETSQGGDEDGLGSAKNPGGTFRKKQVVKILNHQQMEDAPYITSQLIDQEMLKI